jgi:Domain of unknown function (DUF4062)
MPKGFAPSVFVSSTCYDLSQIRTDLRDFLQGLGIEPLLSEHPMFPVNPQITTTANCVSVVKERADIFVLIVGARYGTQDETGKSITNCEYLEARTKGTPIYIFLWKPILHTLPVWKNNRDGDYKGVVDTPKLFEFAESLRDTKEHWVFPFETARDIIDILRQQFAYLFMDALEWRERLKAAHLTPLLSELTGDSLRFAVHKPVGWEHRLLCAVLKEELTGAQTLRWDATYKLQLEKPIALNTTKEFTGWTLPKVMQISRFVDSARDLIERALVEAMAPKGVPANPEHLVYVAKRLGSIYRATLEWKIDFQTIAPSPHFQLACNLCAQFAQNLLQAFEKFVSELEKTIGEAVEARRLGKTYSGTVSLVFDVPVNPELSAELDRIGREIIL